MLRDGKVRLMSGSLLVPGDLVLSREKDSTVCDKCPLRDQLLSHLKHPQRQLPLSTEFARCRMIFTWALLAACVLQTRKLAIWPLLMLSSQLPLVLWWLAGNAHLSLLAALLVASPKPYAEVSEDDAFDEEAPPPVLNVSISPFKVVKSAFDTTKRASILRGDLVEALGLLSVLSFTDREGAIAEVRKSRSDNLMLFLAIF